MSADPPSRPEPPADRPTAQRDQAAGRRSALLRFADLLDAAVEVSGRTASWLALAMVLVISFNVFRRYVFGVSSVALQELEWHLMVPLVLFGLSYALLHREHVRVDFLFELFPKAVQDAVDAVSGVATVIISILIIDFSLDYANQSLAMGEGSPDPGGLSHRFILKGFIPLGFALLAVAGAAVALRHAVYALWGRPHDG
jgi:TRAP-type mannitol/chloroaromatic compound transport system permease small subunit